MNAPEMVVAGSPAIIVWTFPQPRSSAARQTTDLRLTFCSRLPDCSHQRVEFWFVSRDDKILRPLLGPANRGNNQRTLAETSHGKSTSADTGGRSANNS